MTMLDAEAPACMRPYALRLDGRRDGLLSASAATMITAYFADLFLDCIRLACRLLSSCFRARYLKTLPAAMYIYAEWAEAPR